MAPPSPYEFTRAEYNALVGNIPHPVTSQRSEYEEIELVEDCTLYDLYRQPREPVADPAATRTLLVRVLNAELTCPICLGIIRNTEVVMECLHRFCGDCIQRCLRVAKMECPSCRMHIPSRRSLRRDTNFDALIAKIYPNLDEFNSQEEKLIAELNRERHFNNARTQSTKMGVQNQQTLRRNGGKKKLSSDAEDDVSTPPSSSEAAAAASNGHSEDKKRAATWADALGATTAATNGVAATPDFARKKQRTASMSSDSSVSTTATVTSTKTEAASPSADDDEGKINFRLVLHPQEPNTSLTLTRSLFKTSYKLKVRHVKKHLTQLLKLDSFENIHIVLPAKNCALSGLSASVSAYDNGEGKAVIRKDLKFDQELEDYVSLYDIYQQYGRGTKWELQLYYHFSDTIVNGVAQFISSGV